MVTKGSKKLFSLLQVIKCIQNLKWEAGVHRVQRVPKTETMGRVHTSTITIAVMPEVDEVEFELKSE